MSWGPWRHRIGACKSKKCARNRGHAVILVFGLAHNRCNRLAALDGLRTRCRRRRSGRAGARWDIRSCRGPGERSSRRSTPYGARQRRRPKGLAAKYFGCSGHNFCEPRAFRPMLGAAPKNGFCQVAPGTLVMRWHGRTKIPVKSSTTSTSTKLQTPTCGPLLVRAEQARALSEFRTQWARRCCSKEISRLRRVSRGRAATQRATGPS